MARRSIGHLEQSGPGRWKLKLNLGKDIITGQYQQKWFSFRGSKIEAEKYLDKLKAEYLTGNQIKPQKITLSDFMDRWLREYAKVNLSSRSYERYAALVNSKILPKLGNITLSVLRPEHLQKFYADFKDTKLSARTIRYVHAIIHRALVSAIKWRLINYNPADNLELPKPRRVEMEVWNEGEVQQFLVEAKKTTYYSMFYLFLYTGCRRSEILGLKWNDVDFKQKQITIRRGLHQLRDNSFIFGDCKTDKSRRTIQLPASAAEVLFNHKVAKEYEAKQLGNTLDADDLVFNQLGQPYRPNSITRTWTTIAKRAGVKVIRLHDSRHSHVALMIKAGIDIAIISKRLGHSSIGVTVDTYGHLLKGVQEGAALKFDELVTISNHTEAKANTD